MEYVKGHWELPQKKNVLVLIAVDIGGKNTQKWTRLESERPPGQVQR